MLLGIESSCDESAVALLSPQGRVLQNLVHTQIEVHKPYGGVVPDMASREHLTHLPRLVQQLFASNEQGLHIKKSIEAIAVTTGPGLAPCLAQGLSCAAALSLALNVPLLGVNHLHGHALSVFMAEDAPGIEAALPHLGLLVSGGNTLLFEINKKALHKNKELKTEKENENVSAALHSTSKPSLTFTIIGQTLDDAAGEAFDKGAKLMGLPYPGGPQVQKIAEPFTGNIKSLPFTFPQAFKGEKSRLDFSFSGLKTSLRYTLEKMSSAEKAAQLPALCAAYQQAIVGQLAQQTKRALGLQRYASIGLSGGVALNAPLRSAISKLAHTHALPLLCAPTVYCADNAAMVAYAAHTNPAATTRINPAEASQLTIQPSWPITFA